MGVGWQDPAVILETGLCAWRSGIFPVLDFKCNPDWLKGKMALLWTGQNHYTPGNTNNKRDYQIIQKAGQIAREAALKKDFQLLCEAVNLSYEAQIKEKDDSANNMTFLPVLKNALAWKYCGGGWGGYALYLFSMKKLRDESGLMIIEPYIRGVL